MSEIKTTKLQRSILVTLYDVDKCGEPPVTLKNNCHSSAAILVERGLIEKIDRGFYRPVYRITEAGKRFYVEAKIEEQWNRDKGR